MMSSACYYCGASAAERCRGGVTCKYVSGQPAWYPICGECAGRINAKDERQTLIIGYAALVVGVAFVIYLVLEIVGVV